MGKVRIIQSALNAGEMSPLLRGRTDIPRYSHGLELCRNAIPLVWGGARRKPGTRYVAQASGDTVRLITFPVTSDGVTTGYVIELGDQKLRIYRNGSRINSGGNAYQLTTPYPAALLLELEYTWSDNTLYLLHPDHPPRRLYRTTSDTNWTLEAVPFTAYPMLRPPDTKDITLTPSATSGTITLTASAAFFTAEHVGCVIGVNDGTCTITAVTSATLATATVGTSPVADTDIKTIDNQVTVTYTPPSDVDPDWIDFLNDTSSPWSFSISIRADYDATTLTVTPDSSLPDGITVSKTQTINKLTGTEADPDWTEQAWSSRLGWPGSGTFYEGRLILAGSPGYPTYEWGSSSDDELDFGIGTLDSDGFAFNLRAAATTVRHVYGTDTIATFTADRELTVAGSSDAALSPTNVKITSRTPHGANRVRPVLVGSKLFFVTPTGQRLRGFEYQYLSNSYVAGDVAFVANHLVTGIRDMDYAREPDNLLWATTDDGNLLTLTLDLEQEITAWAAHGDDAARYLSVTVARSADGAEQVWLAVQRYIGRQWVCGIELLDEGLNTHAAVTAGGASLTTVAGLDHLNGCGVDVVADGLYAGRTTVAAGAITLPYNAQAVEVGLPYTTTIKDLPVELIMGGGQSIQGAATAVNRIRVRLHESQGCTVNGEQIPFRAFPAIDQPIPVFTGDKEVFNLGRGSNPEQSQVTIVQELPFPLTVLAIVKEVAVNG